MGLSDKGWSKQLERGREKGRETPIKCLYSNCLRKAANCDCKSAMSARSFATSSVRAATRSVRGDGVEAYARGCAADSTADACADSPDAASAAAASSGDQFISGLASLPEVGRYNSETRSPSRCA